MDSITLLVEEAQGAGLEVIADGERLVIRGPNSASALARQLLARKAEMLALLAGPGYPLTLIWPAGIQSVGMVEGQWRQLDDERIEATYPSLDALALAMSQALAKRRAELEAELDAVLADIRTCDDDVQEAALVAELYAKMDVHQRMLEAATV